jgi:hypothetical protein
MGYVTAAAEAGAAKFFTKWHDPIREKQFPAHPVMH